jgi:hypothetical protein
MLPETSLLAISYNGNSRQRLIAVKIQLPNVRFRFDFNHALMQADGPFCARKIKPAAILKFRSILNFPVLPICLINYDKRCLSHHDGTLFGEIDDRPWPGQPFIK